MFFASYNLMRMQSARAAEVDDSIEGILAQCRSQVVLEWNKKCLGERCVCVMEWGALVSADQCPSKTSCATGRVAAAQSKFVTAEKLTQLSDEALGHLRDSDPMESRMPLEGSAFGGYKHRSPPSMTGGFWMSRDYCNHLNYSFSCLNQHCL